MDSIEIRQFTTSVGLALAALVAGGPASATADDPEIVEETQHYAAGRLVVQGLAASALSISGEARGDIELTIRGAAEEVERVRAELRAGTLHLSSKPQVVTADGGSVTTILGPGHNVVVARGVGRATTSIGSVTQSVTGHGQSVVIVNGVTVVTGPAEPIEVEARVPLDALVEVDAYTGEVRIEELQTPVRLGLAGGRADLARVAGGRLAIQGSGEIHARELAGDLAVNIAGSGSVQVAKADLEHLEVQIAGAGKVGIAGRAERARLGIAGSGAIEVDEVIERPEVSILGAGRVRVGNW